MKKHHQEFMETYGCLIEDLDLERVGKNVCIAVPIIKILNKLLTSFMLVEFLNMPYFTIIFFIQS